MSTNGTLLKPVLMADDDPDDRSLAEEAFKTARVRNPLRFVEDGEKLLAYLHDCAGKADEPCLPALILLDLNMPGLDGREALRAIKHTPGLQVIPVVVWTTSQAEEDIASAQAAGCDAFITKPPSFSELVRLVGVISDRWLRAPAGGG